MRWSRARPSVPLDHKEPRVIPGRAAHPHRAREPVDDRAAAEHLRRLRVNLHGRSDGQPGGKHARHRHTSALHEFLFLPGRTNGPGIHTRHPQHTSRTLHLWGATSLSGEKVLHCCLKPSGFPGLLATQNRCHSLARFAGEPLQEQLQVRKRDHRVPIDVGRGQRSLVRHEEVVYVRGIREEAVTVEVDRAVQRDVQARCVWLARPSPPAGNSMYSFVVVWCKPDLGAWCAPGGIANTVSSQYCSSA